MPGCHITDQQIRLFMSYIKTNTVATASARSGFSESTGWRIKNDPRLPSEKKEPRGRRRPDPLADVFENEVVPMLRVARNCIPLPSGLKFYDATRNAMST